MPMPLSYSEADLAAYMVDTLADVAVALGWTATTPQVVRAIYATERVIDVADVADATDVRQVETIAAREAWRAATGAAASRYDASIAAGPNARRSQLYSQCRDNFLAASTDAAHYDGSIVIGVASVTYAPDVYGPLDATTDEMG